MAQEPDKPTRPHAPPRFLITSFPASGHINPALRLADSLGRLGCHVTFLSTVFGLRRTGGGPTHGEGVTFATFSDGHDDGFSKEDRAWGYFDQYSAELRRVGSEALRGLVRSGIEEGRPYACLVYTLIIPWAADVAAELDTPAAVLWVQSATVFVVKRHYFHGYGDTIKDMYEESSSSSSSLLKLPGLEEIEFAADDLPTILRDAPSILEHFRLQLEAIERAPRGWVLANTIDGLEAAALRAMGRVRGLSPVAVGPLIHSGGSGDRFGVEWLDVRPKGSVVYVSFGSVVVLSRAQIEEVAGALLGLGRPFLWALRKEDSEEEGEIELSRQEELDKLGLTVPWCGQVDVLRHEAVSCFVSHCGWNSTLESLACGVPVVALPQHVDQTTNAKLIEDVWKTGLRARPRPDSTDGGVVGADEIKRCLEAVIGGEEFATNAENWRVLCGAAASEGGSSHKNLKAFVAEVTRNISD